MFFFSFNERVRLSWLFSKKARDTLLLEGKHINQIEQVENQVAIGTETLCHNNSDNFPKTKTTGSIFYAYVNQSVIAMGFFLLAKSVKSVNNDIYRFTMCPLLTCYFNKSILQTWK